MVEEGKPKPVVGEGSEIEVKWPVMSKGGKVKHKTFSGKVKKVEKTKTAKKGSFFKYTIQFSDGDTQTTRLLHLDYMIKNDPTASVDQNGVPKKRKKKCTEDDSAEGGGAPASSPSKKKKSKTAPAPAPSPEEGALTAAPAPAGALPAHRFVLAPMVGASELPFRLLCRRHGAALAYTPMLHAARFATDPAYRAEQFQTCAEDRPLVAHFCGNDPATLVAAARHVEGQCDAVDLNLGCPQRVAHSGHFGSYLLGEEDRPLLRRLVAALAGALRVPVFVKIRLLDTYAETLRLVRQLRAAGAALVAVHARERVCLVGRTGPGARAGPAKLDQVKRLVEDLPGVPILANGNVCTWADVERNRDYTGAAGVMSAEGLLDNPALFRPALAAASGGGGKEEEEKKKKKKKAAGDEGGGGEAPPAASALALEYLDLVERYPAALKSVIFHVRRMLKAELGAFQLLQEALEAKSLAEVRAVVLQVVAFERDPAGFRPDPLKEQRLRQAAKRKREEEGKRKRYEARVVRKAKREGRPEDYYLNLGAEVPSVEKVKELKDMVDKDAAFDIWKKDHSQHCYNFHFAEGGCQRDRACAFLHADQAMESVAYG